MSTVSMTGHEGYGPMLQEIGKFFHGGAAPVSMDETLEIIAIIDAGGESKRQNGATVRLEDVFRKARASNR